MRKVQYTAVSNKSSKPRQKQQENNIKKDKIPQKPQSKQ